MFFSTALSFSTLFHLSIAGYVLQDDYMKDFYSNFNFFTATDPTNGFVKYVDQATAQKSGLIGSNSSGAAQWGVDTTNKTPQGRPSIRLESHKKYDSGLIVIDVAHMPTGCGTWPAFWMVGPSWPSNGEIDIIEGVNDQTTNAMTLHTGAGCSISNTVSGYASSSKVKTSNCDVNAANQDKNVGCSIGTSDTKSYGTGLNSNSGGVYATLFATDAISVWFFPRGGNVPKDVLGDSPNPSSWGLPTAKFSGSCDIPKFFKNQQIVFDTTFCGDWAGAKDVWSASGSSCGAKASTCQDWVQNNPSAFKEAYWSINALKVYQANGQAQPSSPAGSGSASSANSAKPSSSGGAASSIGSVPAPQPTTLATSRGRPSHASSGANSGIPTGVPTGRPSRSGQPQQSASGPKPSGANTGNAAAPSAAAPSGAAPSASLGQKGDDSPPAVHSGPMGGFSFPGHQGGAQPSQAASTGAGSAAVSTSQAAAATSAAAVTSAAAKVQQSPNEPVEEETVYKTVVVTVGPRSTPETHARHRARHQRHWF